MNPIELFYKAYNFEIMEAEILDEENYDSWLKLLDEDFEYVVALGNFIQGKKLSFEKNSQLFKADKNKWRVFIDRLKSDYGWAYQYSQTRLRRIVSNIRIADFSEDKKIINVNNNIIVLRINGEEQVQQPIIISGKREDSLALHNDEIRLKKRIVYLDHSSYPSYNLYFPL
ncbi:hypothetical protein EWF20_01020 [Sulfolobus sp. S-194]|uniref:aromatic-ring-hydroxylating dioxygenase subunit beta n=1 Tax=Sulfolobus sp. S-194 TaxID=2512240 RepID=UPI001436ED36|nr:aromatic-ring-hydroxylating dioxygenase subunit beta [Sulfolobus sp. S-194]QIW22875.1 hypothetical protein EWF20_01020 [Sulfolobus sp. S-194]